MSQTDEVLALLREKRLRGVTPGEALDRVGTMRLAARVAELRAQGYDIRNVGAMTPTRKHVACYILFDDPAPTA